MRALTIEDLNAAAHVGGAGSLTMRQELEPASGPDGVIAPAKYVDDRGNATYIFAKRYEEDQEKPVKTVMIDSKGSFANRAEETTTEAMRNGEGVLSKMPRIAVQYDTDAGKEVVYDNQLPHRGFDGHIRVGSYKGESTSKAEEYVKARNSTLDNLLPIFELSPETVIFGGWDSTRSKNQLRIPSVMVGETYAILAEQEEDPVIHRAGGRIDPVGASVIVSTEADRNEVLSLNAQEFVLRSLIRAALLHDYFLYDWHDWDNGTHRLHGFTHGKTAMRNAIRDFKLNQIERDSIEHHMFPLTPYPPKYIEGYLVTAADKISATKETLSFDRFDKPASEQPTDRS